MNRPTCRSENDHVRVGAGESTPIVEITAAQRYRMYLDDGYPPSRPVAS